MSEHWGPWIAHDGAVPSIPLGSVVEVLFQGPGVKPEEGSVCDLTAMPGFYWRWKRVRIGWFSSEMRRVCDDPAYAPVIRYRIRRPRGMVVLDRILADLPEQVDA